MRPKPKRYTVVTTSWSRDIKSSLRKRAQPRILIPTESRSHQRNDNKKWVSPVPGSVISIFFPRSGYCKRAISPRIKNVVFFSRVCFQVTSTLQATRLTSTTNEVMSRGQYKVEAADPDDDTSDIELKAIAHRDPNVQQNGNDINTLTPAAVVQASQGAGAEGAVANQPKKLVVEIQSERVREATEAVVTAGALLLLYRSNV